MLKNFQGDSWGSILPLRMPSLLPYDLCHGRSSSRWLPASSKERPGMLLNILQCTRQPPLQRMIQPQVSIVWTEKAYLEQLLPRTNFTESEVAQSCPTLCDRMDCSLSGSSVHGIFQGCWSGLPFPSLITQQMCWGHRFLALPPKMLGQPIWKLALQFMF